MNNPVATNADQQLAQQQVVPEAVCLLRSLADPWRPTPILSAAARHALTTHDWNGSRAELAACIERALVLCEGVVIAPEHLAIGDASGAGRSRDVILRRLREEHGVRTTAAARLGISPSTLRYRLAAMRDNGIAINQKFEW